MRWKPLLLWDYLLEVTRKRLKDLEEDQYIEDGISVLKTKGKRKLDQKFGMLH